MEKEREYNGKTLKDIKGAALAATPGPWRECGHDRGGCRCGLVWSIPADAAIAKSVNFDEFGEMEDGLIDDARHIATSDPVTVLALLKHIEELEGKSRAKQDKVS